MSQVYSIYEAKARFSELVKKAKSGKELIVTERGRAVAKLVPYQEETSLEERLCRLKANGQILPRQAKTMEPIASVPGALARFLKDRE